MTALKKRYLELIENGPSGIVSAAFYGILAVLSVFYGALITLINALYDIGFYPRYDCPRPVVSIGNISWGGSGKSTLALKVYDYLAKRGPTALLRRGYGKDEEAMFKARGAVVYSGKDRAALARAHRKDYDYFILDDGFQHRKLGRDLDIVVMAAREFRKPPLLIPVSIFREPFASLRRAGLVLINYKSELADASLVRSALALRYPSLPVYFSDYRIVEVGGPAGKRYAPSEAAAFGPAAVTAIGYPQGFFNKLKEAGIAAACELFYPDHHQLSGAESDALAILLEKRSVTHIIITEKDAGRFDRLSGRFTILTARIEMVIENEQEMMEYIGKQLVKKDA